MGSARSESATWDETHYFGLGAYLLETGRWDVPGAILHPPLSFYLSAVPLLSIDLDPALFARPAPPVTDPGYLDFLGTADIPRGQALLSSTANANDALLTESRLMTVGLAVVLGAFVWAWSDARFGYTSGLLAAVLFVIDPNLLAHSHLITPDLSVTAFTFIAVYYLWLFLTDGRSGSAVRSGGALGLALLSKYTAVLMLPLFLLLVGVWRMSGRRISGRGCALLIGVAASVWLAGYRFDPAPYFQGLDFQWEHAAAGQAAFLMGQVSPYGWWYYFAVAFALKTPLALLGLLVTSVVLLVRRFESQALLADAFLVLPAAAVFVFFSLEHQSIGLRYILPVYPFLIVLASRAGTLLDGSGPGRSLVGLAVLWGTVSSFWVFPHYIAYFNEAIGGPSHGYHYLVDSNLDWGQELKDLKRFMQERGITTVYLSYFGTDLPDRYGISYVALPSNMLPSNAPQAPSVLPPSSWVAVSATMLEGVYEDSPLLRALRALTPTAVLGHSMFLFHLP